MSHLAIMSLRCYYFLRFKFHDHYFHCRVLRVMLVHLISNCYLLIGIGNGSHNNPAHGNRREFYSNQSNRGRNFNQRGGRQQSQPRMEYQSFQPFGAPPRFPQTAETQNNPVNNPVMYQNCGPVRQPIFQPRYPDPNPPQNWNNQSQPQ